MMPLAIVFPYYTYSFMTLQPGKYVWGLSRLHEETNKSDETSP